MRILVLNYEFPPVGGGGGRAAEDICRAMAARGHEIRVQTAHVKGLPKKEERDGYTIFRSFSLRRRLDRCTIFEMGTFLLTNFLPSLKHAVEWKPHVIHAHFAVPTGALALCVSLISKIPYVLTAHLGDVPGAIPDQTELIFKWVKPFSVPVWRKAGFRVAVAEHVRELAFRAYGLPIKVIPNGIRLSHLESDTVTLSRPKRLIFAGRFNEQKNLGFMLDVLGKVSDENWHMHMLGNGPLMEELRRKIRNMGLSDRVSLHGWVDPLVVEKTMSKSDIFILPSNTEGLPIAGILAIGKSLAILGSRVGGITDIVKEGVNGFLCEPNDIKSFENALRKMLSSDELLIRMKKNSRTLASKFDIEKVATSYERVFQEVASSRTDLLN